ncbi:hydrolase/acyltransferase [Brevibacillus humidisoli]|uniref:hydrolase/acyltransferase n=1 Tax=Brevibacillus humidisoli TaxID=2895522 RepID=UPI001E4B6255|nr:hydrolase/acyltransferase [Brevibacillus humidisoli]UFJ40954.1 hydrolase/acyltransferase [Brevibacillus humidisoli]
MRYLLLADSDRLCFVSLPDSYMYQLVALIKRLYKEIDKLTSEEKPPLPKLIAECGSLDLYADDCPVLPGLTYVSELEQRFARLPETQYPLISLLTEIRALQAQLEFLQEEEESLG